MGTILVADRGVVDALDGFLYETADLGRPRVDAARARVAALNPDVRVVDAGAAADAAPHVLAAVPATDAVDALARGAEAARRVIAAIVASGVPDGAA